MPDTFDTPFHGPQLGPVTVEPLTTVIATDATGVLVSAPLTVDSPNFHRYRLACRPFPPGEAPPAFVAFVSAVSKRLLNDTFRQEWRHWRSTKANADRLGLEYDEEWHESFAAFLLHIGPRPRAGSIDPRKQNSVDRIDCALGYVPTNVRWATPTQQSQNRANVIAAKCRRRSPADVASCRALEAALNVNLPNSNPR
jgi:hypothetical protein